MCHKRKKVKLYIPILCPINCFIYICGFCAVAGNDKAKSSLETPVENPRKRLLMSAMKDSWDETGMFILSV